MTDYDKLNEKLDNVLASLNELKTDMCVRVSLLEKDVGEHTDKIRDIKAKIQPFINMRWLFLSIPSLLAVVASIIAIVKVFAKMP